MSADDTAILKFIASKAERPMKIKEMAKALQINSADYPQFRKSVSRLLDSGELVNLKRGRIGLADQLNVAVGKLTMTRSGTGYLVREGKDVDIMIPQW